MALDFPDIGQVSTYIDRNTIIAVGTNGSDMSRDGGKTWKKIGNEDLNAVQAKGKKAVWAVGPKGFVGHLGTASLSNSKKPEVGVLPMSVDDLRLSQTEVNLKCPETNPSCSKDGVILVQTVAPAADFAHKYVYTVSAGKIIGRGPTVEWDLTGIKPGTYTITAGISEPILDGESWEIVGRTVTKQVVVHDGKIQK